MTLNKLNNNNIKNSGNQSKFLSAASKNGKGHNTGHLFKLAIRAVLQRSGGERPSPTATSSPVLRLKIKPGS